MHVGRCFGNEKLVVWDLGDAQTSIYRFSKKWQTNHRKLVRCPKCKDLVPKPRIENGKCNWC